MNVPWCLLARSSNVVKLSVKCLESEQRKWQAMPQIQLQRMSPLQLESPKWWNQFRFKVMVDIQLSWLHCLYVFPTLTHSRVLHSNHKKLLSWYHYISCTHKPHACSGLLIQSNFYSLMEPLKLLLAQH